MSNGTSFNFRPCLANTWIVMDYIEYVEMEQISLVVFRPLRDYSNPLTYWNEEEFLDRFRFRKASVIALHAKLVPHFIPSPNNRGVPVSRILQLLITLRFYACGLFHRENSDLFGISESTVCRVVHQFSKLLCKLKFEYIDFPDAEERTNLKRGFFSIANFPGKSRKSLLLWTINVHVLKINEFKKSRLAFAMLQWDKMDYQ